MNKNQFNKLEPGSIVVVCKNIVNKDHKSFEVALDDDGHMKEYAGTVARVIRGGFISVRLESVETGEMLSSSHWGIPWAWSHDTIRHPRGSERQINNTKEMM